ncbi:MAG: hypothetical protein U9N33_02355 [Campylobacterota bacterium]|nr:hypothetical protein [Campylobacterota bacterium]
MKSLIISLLIILSITACQDSSPYKQKSSPALMNQVPVGVNPNSLAYKSADKQKDRENKVEISKIDADAKIEIAKITSGNELLIAKVNADAQKEVAITDSTTKIQTSKLDVLVKKDDIQNDFYITIAIIAFLLVAILLFYLNSKKNRDIKLKIQQEQLKHEQHLKEREHDEKRLHKMLDLVGKGKLPPEMEVEIITSLTEQKRTLLESK